MVAVVAAKKRLSWPIIAIVLAHVALHWCSAISATTSVALPFGDFNVLILTDVHSWIGGHGYKEPNLNADYGHVMSFYQRLKEHCLEMNMDLWFVVNGDWIDGTALAINGDPSYLIPLLEKMPWDAVNIGNHELYRNDVIDYMSRPGGFVEWWGSRLLSSNIIHADSQEPVGNLYRILHGKNQSILTFGFLFNMLDHGEHVSVTSVQTVIEQSWFESALRDEKYDAILVLAHMDAVDDLVTVILTKIRHVVGSQVPIQFVTGHSHRRFVATPDNASSSVEAGRFLDTVGFVSFPSKTHLQSTPRNQTSDLFQHVLLDANVNVLQNVLGVETLLTEDGAALSHFITKTQDELGLHDVIGCLKDSFYLNNRTVYDHDSLWRFFNDEIVPTQFDEDVVTFMGQASWRYDLLGGGDMRLDDIVAVSPFNESFVGWRDVPYEVIQMLNETMNDGNSSFLPLLPLFVLSSAKPFENDGTTYTLLASQFESEEIGDVLTQIYSNDALPPAESLNVTTTGIWLKYFEENHVGCKPSSHGTPNKHKPGSPSLPLPGGFKVSDQQMDGLRIAFAVVASLVVVSLATVIVRQRGVIWRARVERQEYETMDAIREREEEEGEFI